MSVVLQTAIIALIAIALVGSVANVAFAAVPGHAMPENEPAVESIPRVRIPEGARGQFESVARIVIAETDDHVDLVIVNSAWQTCDDDDVWTNHPGDLVFSSEGIGRSPR